MKKVAAIAVVLSGTSPCYPQGSNVTHGACSPIITGNQGSTINNNCRLPRERPKPSLSDIKEGVIDYNKFPGYMIEGVDYRNGYPEENDKYVVDVALNIETRMSCDEIGKGAWIPKEAKGAALIVGMAGIKIAWMLGTDCKAGEKFALLYAEELQKTENGWVIINQDTIGAERR